MFSFVQQLCELEHVLSARNLKLATVSLLRLSVPDEHLSVIPSLQSLITLVSAGTWVTRGNGLKVTFCLNIEGISDTIPDRIELTEALAVLLQDAEMWKQLGFQVALSVPVECEADNEQRPDFVLDLTLADPHGSTNTKSKADGTHVTAYDPRPPKGIVSVYLEEIIVKLSFLHILPRNNLVRKRKADDTTIKPDPNRLCDRIGGYLGSMSYVERYSYAQAAPNQDVTEEILFDVDPTVGNGLGLDDNVMLDADAASQESVVSSTFSQVSVSSSSTAISLGPLCNTKISADNVLKTNNFMIEDFTGLIDSAFRKMICGERTLNAKGVTCSKGSKGPMLAEIAPALFCPGYQAAIAHRNGLASAIARSIASIHRRSKSPTFRLDIQRMTVLSLDERICILREGLDEGPNDQSHSDVTAAIKLRLWQVSQRILFYPSIVRRLKPIQYSSDRGLGEDALSQVMLDEDVYIPHSTNQSAEVDDCLLLDDGPSSTSCLSIDDGIQDEHNLFDDLLIDDDDDLLDTDEYGDESLDSLLFDLDDHEDVDFMDLETIEHWKSIDGSCIIEEGITENMLYQEKSSAQDSIDEDNSMLEDCS